MGCALVVDMLIKSLGGIDLSLVIYHNENNNLYDINMGFVTYVEETYKIKWGKIKGYYNRPLSDVLNYLKRTEDSGMIFPFALDSMEEEIKKYKLKCTLDEFVNKEE